MSAGSAQIFLSHSNRDRADCDAISAALRRRDMDPIFVDYDPADGIPPGRDWELELYQALRRCDVVLALDSAAWRRSRWCFTEVALARSLGKKVILLRSTRPPKSAAGAAALVRDTQAFVLTGGIDAAEPLFAELKRLGIGSRLRFRWDPSRSPYVGLSPLDEADAGVFFGRERDVRAVVDLVEQCARYGEKSLVLLVGPSGSGKSSLLRAGVLPQLRSRRDWMVIGPTLADADVPLPLTEVASLSRDQRALFALDQMDEALTGPPEVASRMIASLAELAGAHRGRGLVLATLRAESLDLLNERLGSLASLAESYVVGPLRPRCVSRHHRGAVRSRGHLRRCRPHRCPVGRRLCIRLSPG